MSRSYNNHLASPTRVFHNSARYNIETGRFSGPKSFDGHIGGIPLAYDSENNRLILDNSDTHTICFGASGSKKTRALVMPTIYVLAQAGESMIINDSKGELFERTGSMLKKEGYKIITLNLRSPEVGNAWNPLTLPYYYYKLGDMDKAAEFANDIATSLCLADVSAKDPYWDYSSCDVMYGLLLLTMKYCFEHKLPDSAVSISNLLKLRRKLFENGRNAKMSELWKYAEKDELIAASLSGCIMTAEDTRNGILSVLDQKLRCFVIAPTLLDMLSSNNIDISEIGNEKTAVFLITPDEKTTFHRLVSVFISQSYQHLIYCASKAGGRVKVRINYILDEFSSLPAIGNDFSSYIAAARSRNIKFLIIVQSKNQLIRRYAEEAATITANCANWIFLFSRELELLKDLETLCGTQTNGKPNISLYDLQHLNKDRNEALLLYGRNEPCMVNLLDIDRLYKTKDVLPFETPERTNRTDIDFAVSLSPMSNMPKQDSTTDKQKRGIRVSYTDERKRIEQIMEEKKKCDAKSTNPDSPNKADSDSEV